MWTPFKVFIKIVTILLLFYVLIFSWEACEISAPRPRIEPSPLNRKAKSEPTGSPGKSREFFTLTQGFPNSSDTKDIFFEGHLLVSGGGV